MAKRKKSTKAKGGAKKKASAAVAAAAQAPAPAAPAAPAAPPATAPKPAAFISSIPATAARRVAGVLESWPGREDEAWGLAQALLAGGLVLVKGPESTGKTGLVRDITAALDIKLAYVSLDCTLTVSGVLTSILTQLGCPLAPRRAEVGGEPPKKRGPGRRKAAAAAAAAAADAGGPAGEEDAPVDGDGEAPGEGEEEGGEGRGGAPAVGRRVMSSRFAAECMSSLSSFLSSLPPLAPVAVVVDDVDSVGGLLEADDVSDTLKHLRNVLCSRPLASFVLVSQRVVTDALGDRDQHLRLTPHAAPVHSVAFRPYSEASLVQILQREAAREGDEGYRSFVQHSVPTLSRNTHNLSELRSLIRIAYRKYLQGVEGSKHEHSTVMFARAKPILTEATLRYGQAATEYRVIGAGVRGGGDEAGPSTGRNPRRAAGAADPVPGSGELSDALENHGIPTMGKFLLLAGYIAARNSQALDSELFNIGTATRKRRRNTVKGVSLADVLEEKRRQARNRAPGTFSLDRLLAIFWRMYENEGLRQDEEEAEDDQEEEELAGQILKERRYALSCTVMHELATLERVRLLLRSEDGSVLSGTAELRCAVQDDMAERLAKSVNVKLNNYVLYTN